MHHYLSKEDWLSDVNERLRIRRDGDIPFRLFHLVQLNWEAGQRPEDVAEALNRGAFDLRCSECLTNTRLDELLLFDGHCETCATNPAR